MVIARRNTSCSLHVSLTPSKGRLELRVEGIYQKLQSCMVVSAPA